MFKKLFGKPKDQPKSARLLVFICLRDAGPIQWEQVQSKIGNARPVKQESPEGGTFEFPNGSVHAAYMPMPIPNNEVEAQAPFSRFWKDEYSARHGAHVVLIGMGDLAAGMENVCKVASAISATHATAAWYCGNASHILHPGIASDFVESGMTLPIWVNVICSQNASGGGDASTLGMEALGHNEFEVVGSRHPQGEIYELLLDLASYVLDNGPVLKHGNTFGRTADERFAIEVGRSKLGKPGTVIRLNWS